MYIFSKLNTYFLLILSHIGRVFVQNAIFFSLYGNPFFQIMWKCVSVILVFFPSHLKKISFYIDILIFDSQNWIFYNGLTTINKLLLAYL